MNNRQPYLGGYPNQLYIPTELTDPSGFRVVSEDTTRDDRAKRIEREALQAWEDYCFSVGIDTWVAKHLYTDDYEEQRSSFLASEERRILEAENRERDLLAYHGEEDHRWAVGGGVESHDSERMQRTFFPTLEPYNVIEGMVQAYVEHCGIEGVEKYRQGVRKAFQEQMKGKTPVFQAILEAMPEEEREEYRHLLQASIYV